MKLWLSIFVAVLLAVNAHVLRQKLIRVKNNKGVQKIELSRKGQTLQQRLLDSLRNDKIFHKNQAGLDESEYNTLILDLQGLSLEESRSHLNTIVAVPLVNYYNAQYFGNVQVGSQRQQMSVMFDTGSSYIWFASTTCSGCHKSGIANYYNCSQSQTCQDEGQQVVLKYGSGDANAYSVIDDITVGGLTANKQYLLVLETLKQLPSFMGDGLLGMGFPTLAKNHPTLMDTLFTEGQIQSKVFSIYLSNLETNAQKPSALIIGGIDTQYFDSTSTWTYCNVVSDYYWGVTIDSLSFIKGGSIFSLVTQINPISTQPQFSFQSKFAVIDSGTSILTLDGGDFQNVFEFFNRFGLGCIINEKYGLISCENSDQTQYPVIQVSMCSSTFQIQPSDYLLCEGLCYILIEKLNFPVTILGDIFIREYYTLYNQQDPKTIGFVKSKY